MDRLAGSTLGAMRLGFTLGENTGRDGNLVGVLSSARVGRSVLSSMWPFLLLFIDIFCEGGWCVASARGLGVAEKKDGEAAASLAKVFFNLVYRGPSIPFQWVQRVRHCSRAGFTRRRMLRCWG